MSTTEITTPVYQYVRKTSVKTLAALSKTERAGLRKQLNKEHREINSAIRWLDGIESIAAKGGAK